MKAELRALTPSDVDRFMGNYASYRSNMKEHARDGCAEAVEALNGFVDELAPERRGQENRGQIPTENRGQIPIS